MSFVIAFFIILIAVLLSATAGHAHGTGNNRVGNILLGLGALAGLVAVLAARL